MIGTIPEHLKKPCPMCGGTGCKSGSVMGICERCTGTGVVPMEHRDFPTEKLTATQPQR